MDLPQEYLHTFYKDLVKIIGLESTKKLYDYYKGQQVTFPIRLYDKQKVLTVICQRYNGSNTKELAREFGYSERWVRKMIKENME